MGKKGKFDINAVTIPTFSVQLLDGKSVKVRAIIMKEYRNLLLAKDGSSDVVDHITAIEQVVQNCIVEDIDVDTLTAYDYENIFVKSFEFGTGSKDIPVSFQCTNDVVKTDEEGVESVGPCATLMKNKIVFDNIKPSIPNNDIPEEKTFVIQEGITVTLTRPSFRDTAYFNAKSGETVIENIIRHFKNVKVGDVISDITMIDQDDMTELFDRIQPTTILEMHEYIMNIPRVSYDMKLKCPSCSKRYNHKLIGIEDFFI